LIGDTPDPGGVIVGIAEDERHLARFEQVFGTENCVVARCRPGAPPLASTRHQSVG
jgi:hypothetical protein